MTTPVLTVRGVDPDLWQQVRILATTRRVSLGHLLNDIIRAYFASQ